MTFFIMASRNAYVKIYARKIQQPLAFVDLRLIPRDPTFLLLLQGILSILLLLYDELFLGCVSFPWNGYLVL